MKKTVKLVALATGFFILGASMNFDKQPLMKEALEHLNKAQNCLSNATADKGGHRAKAMDAVKIAINQVKKGIAYDNKN